MVHRLTLQNLELNNQKVLMRVDFNVPLDKQGHITDDSRIVASLPSIRYILEKGGALILMSHLGRPKDKPVPELSLAPCAQKLSSLLNLPVKIAPDCVGEDVKKLVAQLRSGEVLLLENLRFHRGEEHPSDDPQFVEQLAQWGDVYVNDAFGTAHRAHASTAIITQYFPGKAAAGFLLEKEMRFLGSVLKNPKRPFFAIIGGAKISTKMGVIKALLQKVDRLFIGGGMSYTFFKAQGLKIGESIHEDDYLETAREILKDFQSKILLPEDIVTANAFSNDAMTKVVLVSEGIPDGFQGMDIGPKTIETFTVEIKKGMTILWNGPLGVFEMPKFAKGTQNIAQAIASVPSSIKIVGGGDSLAAVQQLNLGSQFTHLSTGGGASLEYIEYGTLPGIEALTPSS